MENIGYVIENLDNREYFYASECSPVMWTGMEKAHVFSSLAIAQRYKRALENLGQPCLVRIVLPQESANKVEVMEQVAQ